jgi:hypothetical protein
MIVNEQQRLDELWLLQALKISKSEPHPPKNLTLYGYCFKNPVIMPSQAHYAGMNLLRTCSLEVAGA